MDKRTLLAYALGAAVIAGLSGFAIGRGTGFDLEFGAPGYSVKMKVDGNLDPFHVMGALLSDSSMSGAAGAWLMEHQQMMRISDPNLALALDTTACADIGPREAIEALPLRERLDALRACADKPANRELRDRALEEPRGYPFHHVGEPTVASVPGDEPSKGHVNVCERKFIGRSLQVIHAENNRSIFVEGKGKISRCSTVDVVTELHLNGDDAAELFGFRPVTGKHTLYVSISD